VAGAAEWRPRPSADRRDRAGESHADGHRSVVRDGRSGAALRLAVGEHERVALYGMRRRQHPGSAVVSYLFVVSFGGARMKKTLEFARRTAGALPLSRDEILRDDAIVRSWLA
jgi:hypothetical protein